MNSSNQVARRQGILRNHPLGWVLAGVTLVLIIAGRSNLAAVRNSVAELTELQLEQSKSATVQVSHGVAPSSQAVAARNDFLVGKAASLEQALQSLGATLVAFSAIGALSIGLVALSRRHEGQVVEAELETKRQLRLYEELLQHLPIGVFQFSSGTVQFSNPALQSLHAEEANWITKKVGAECLKKLAAAEIKQTDFNFLFALCQSDDSTRAIRMTGVPILDSEGKLLHLLGFAIDETEHYRSEILLQKSNLESQQQNLLLRQTLARLEEHVESAVHALVRAVEAKDPYTAGHSERVMSYAVRLGERLGLGVSELRQLEIGCLVHDVGKIGLPDLILTKPAGLTDEEFQIVKEHPVIGVRILSQMEMFEECLPIVRSHHERLDGSGYPDQLKGDEIPVTVRITSIADAYDAMTSTRAYRHSLPHDTAVERLYEDAARGKFDPELVTIFADMVKGDLAREQENTEDLGQVAA